MLKLSGMNSWGTADVHAQKFWINFWLFWQGSKIFKLAKDSRSEIFAFAERNFFNTPLTSLPKGWEGEFASQI